MTNICQLIDNDKEVLKDANNNIRNLRKDIQISNNQIKFEKQNFEKVYNKQKFNKIPNCQDKENKKDESSVEKLIKIIKAFLDLHCDIVDADNKDDQA